ncbi:MAG: pectinesterase family protein [Bacteroidales bacterium]|nr:pectinesterase family protein [Bacteroidales bacterium]
MRLLLLTLLIGLAISLLPYGAYAQYATEMTVAPDGTGDFKSIQSAIDSCKAFPDKRITIFVKNGIYNEKVRVPSFNTQLSIIGESVEKTIISYNDNFAKINRGRNSTFYSYSLLIEASDFIMENITVENTSGPVGQAIALHVEGDRCVFRNCRFTGNQDTVYAGGKFSRQYFLNCYIEGTTDFIFGEATALFENCTIHCKSDSFITASGTTEGKPYGFVFLNCKLTAADGVKLVYLGRPWRSYAKVAFLNCEMGSFISPEGWSYWSKNNSIKRVKFVEYNNFGPGADIRKRVAWSHKLNKKEVSTYNKERIFAPLGWEISSGKKWFDPDYK